MEYVIPPRWSGDEDLSEFTGYLRDLARMVDVTVVDGSDQPTFTRHAVAWRRFARHLPVENRPGRNRKVAGVVTGVFAARHDHVIIADDDVRYGPKQLAEMASRLRNAVGSRLRGGARYRGDRLPVAATRPLPAPVMAVPARVPSGDPRYAARPLGAVI